MRLAQIKTAAVAAYKDVEKKHTLAMAAALSYYFVLALFPALIFLAGMAGYLPVPNLFNQVLGSIARIVPPESMGLIRRIVADALSPQRGTFLSIGLLGTVWVASSGFAALIEALNIAYDAPETRPFWKTRPLAVALTFIVGTLLMVALPVILAGPRFGEWLAMKVHLGPLLAAVWPYMRWILAVIFTILAVETLYFLAPNVKQRFRCTLPGAILAVGAWLALSQLLGIYFRNFSNFNKTYGTLGAAVALMVWIYWTGFAMLVGAELNSKLLQLSRGRELPLKQPMAIIAPPAAEAA